MTNYYNLNISDTIKATGTSQKGLFVDESAGKLKECGVNELKQNKKISPLRILIRQFTSSIVFILLTALVYLSPDRGEAGRYRHCNNSGP